jgi:hypothetical protein
MEMKWKARVVRYSVASIPPVGRVSIYPGRPLNLSMTTFLYPGLRQTNTHRVAQNLIHTR